MDALLGGIGLFFIIVGFSVALAIVIWATSGFPKFWKD